MAAEPQRDADREERGPGLIVGRSAAVCRRGEHPLECLLDVRRDDEEQLVPGLQGLFASRGVDLPVAQDADQGAVLRPGDQPGRLADLGGRSEEHTSELQSLMRTSYAAF